MAAFNGSSHLSNCKDPISVNAFLKLLGVMS